MISIVPSLSTKNSLEKATREYQQALPGSPGESHLLGRGITRDTISSFRLGFVSDPLSGDEKYLNRISIPYLTVSGVVSIRYRCVDDSRPKYLSSVGDPGRPFNVQSLSRQGMVYITEGEMDAITLDQLGAVAIGIPGAQTWKRVYARFLRFRTITVLADGDEAGRSFANTVGSDVRARVLYFPEGEDVNSTLSKRGSRYLLDWIT